MVQSTKPLPDAVINFDRLPDTALVDVKTVAILFGRSVPSIWRDVDAKRLPAPVRAGPRCTRWIVGNLRRAQAAQRGGDAGHQ